MSLVTLLPTPSHVSACDPFRIARSATFPKCPVNRAPERARNIAGHLLPRTSTLSSENTAMAAMCSKEVDDSNDNTPIKTPTDKTPPKPTTMSPRKPCLECNGTGDQSGKSTGAVNIDGDVPDKYNQIPPDPSPLPVAHRDFVHALPPTPPTYRKFSVFTAGSIEMGAAVQWQRALVTRLSHLPISVTNPRRGHWDPNVSAKAKDAEFQLQVKWELAALEQADVIAFFFDITTLSPVTLLELGLWAASGKVVVCCDERYWRSGNVKIVCERYGVKCVDKFEELAPEVEKMLREKGMEIDERGDLVGSNEHVQKVVGKKTVLTTEK